MIHGKKCSACGEDHAGFAFKLKRWLCIECEMELDSGYVPPYQQVTSRHFNVPNRWSIVRMGRQPGTGEGNDFFGNHT
jgi:hypothetical protein